MLDRIHLGTGKLMMGRKDDIHWKVKFMNFKNYTEIPLPVYMKS